MKNVICYIIYIFISIYCIVKNCLLSINYNDNYAIFILILSSFWFFISISGLMNCKENLKEYIYGNK